MFDGFILMFGGQLINDSNLKILVMGMGHVFSCVSRSTPIVPRMFHKLYEISDNIMDQD